MPRTLVHGCRFKPRMVTNMTKIIIEIEDKPYLEPIRQNKIVFAASFNYRIPEVDDEVTTHCGSEGAHSINQLEDEFKRIIGHLKRQILKKRSVQL